MQSKQPAVNTTVVNAMKTSFQAHVNTFRTRVQSTNGYKFVLNSGDYYWGSNSVALNRAIRLVAASEIFGDQTYKDAAEETLHYILGRNAVNKSYLTYVGEVYTNQPHHQPSVADGITPPWPGILAGGPNEYYDTIGAPAKCYVDDAGNYTSNEVAINWMAAYAYVLAAFVPTPGPTNTPTNTPTSLCHPLTCTFTQTSTPTITPTFMAMRVDVASSTTYTDTLGNQWLADKTYSAGSYGYSCASCASATNNYTGVAVGNTVEDVLYRTERWAGSGASNMEYRFDLPSGWYEVTLLFMEGYFNYAGARSFDVQLEGNTAESALDIYAQSGGKNIALNKVYAVQVADGTLNINLLKSGADYPLINAIQVTTYYPPTATHTYTATNTRTFTNTPTATNTFTNTSTSICYPLTCTFTNTNTHTFTQTPTNTPVPTPIRVNCGGASYLDGAGNTWAADYGFTGGTTTSVTDAIAGTADDTLYQSERYGNPSYTFTVPNGYYDITFKFAETYWTAAGDRIFDVKIEGITVIDNLDLYVKAPGTMRAYDVIIQDVLITDGQVNITSSSVSDVASFRAIAIIPAGPPPTFTYTNTLPPTETFTNTNTHTVTSTHTFTNTYTASDTSTPTHTYTQTSSDTETNTPVPFTDTPTASHTFTDTATDTATSTYTATLTFTDTATDTATHTYTQTPADTNTATVTNTAPPGSTNTHTFTVTNTFTNTSAPSDTYTATHTFTFTFTDTATQTNTAIPPTNTATFTNTHSYTNTPTNTNTFTVTNTPPPGSTSTNTPTDTLIPSNTPTYTFSDTRTNTPTDTAVPPTNTFTNTPSATNTATNTNTPPPGSTNTHTVTNTYTHTYTNTYTATSTAVIPTATNTATATVPAATATFTQTPPSIIAEDAKQMITEVIIYPNPYNPEISAAGPYFRFKLAKNAGEVMIRIYSSSFRLIKAVKFEGIFTAGLNRGYTRAEDFKNLSNGTYYFVLTADSTSGKAVSKADKLIILK